MAHHLSPPSFPASANPTPAPAAAGTTSPFGRALQAVGVGVVAGLGLALLLGFGTFFVGTQAGCSNVDDGWCGLGWFFLGIGVAFIAAGIGYLCAGVVWVLKTEPEGRRALPITLHVVAPAAAAVAVWLISFFNEIGFSVLWGWEVALG